MFVPSTFARVTAPRIGFQSLQSTFCAKPQPETQNKITELRAQFFNAHKELKELGHDPMHEFKLLQFDDYSKAIQKAIHEENSKNNKISDSPKISKGDLLGGLICVIFMCALVFPNESESGWYA